MHSTAHPDAVSFDAEGISSAALLAFLDGPGCKAPVILLAVGVRAQQTAWAARTAVFLAETLGSRGARVILADLSLDEPELHAAVGLDNEEGLSDVFLFGASLEHITLPVSGRSFSLIPASPFTPDSAHVLRHERWGAVFEALAAAQSQLIVYLPMAVAGASAFSDRVGHTIVLAHPDEVQDVHGALLSDADVIAVLLPAGTKAAAQTQIAEQPVDADAQPAMARLDDEQFERIRIPKDGARDALIADLRSRQHAALMAPAPAIAPLPLEETAARPPRPAPPKAPQGPVERVPIPVFTTRTPPPAPKRTRRTAFWLGAVLLAGAAGAGGGYLLQTRARAGAGARAGVVRVDGGGRGTVPAPGLAAKPLAPLASPAVLLRYSVAIASYQGFNIARERLQQLHHEDAHLGYYISPIVAQGALFYRVLAGPVADSAAALALRDTLLARGIKTGTTGWDVLSAPFAFLLGEYQRSGEAQNKQQDAEKKGVPSYIVESAGPDGSLLYKLYAGAYTGPGDAEFMRPILKRAGLPDNLVERTGSIRS